MTETEGPVSTSRIDTMKTLAQAIKKDEKQHPDKNPRPVRLLEVVSWYKRQKYNRETKEPKPIEFVELKPLNLTSAS